MTLETLVIRSHRTKRKKYSTKAMNKIDVGFTYALQKIRFIREDNTPIKIGDLLSHKFIILINKNTLL